MRNSDVMVALLEHNADPDVAGVEGTTPMEVVCEHGDCDMVQALLNQNADPNLRHFNTGITPLFAAAFGGFTSVVSLMLSKGAIPDPKDTDGVTPMMVAAKGGHVKVMQLLASSGASTTVEDAGGDNPTRYAYDSFTVGRRDTLDFLAKVEHWSSLRIAAASRTFCEARDAVKRGGVDPDLRGTWETLNVLEAATAASPFGAVLSGIPNPICKRTIKFVRAATSGWSTKTHWLHHPGVRKAVHVTLLVAERLRRSNGTGALSPGDDHGRIGMETDIARAGGGGGGGGGGGCADDGRTGLAVEDALAATIGAGTGGAGASCSEFENKAGRGGRAGAGGDVVQVLPMVPPELWFMFGGFFLRSWWQVSPPRAGTADLYDLDTVGGSEASGAILLPDGLDFGISSPSPSSPTPLHYLAATL